MLLELSGIQKRFGGVTALGNANLSVDAGEVHLLLGENGAGKSTLMKIVAGIQSRDAGRMLWNGHEVWLRSPAEAAAIGVAMVHQESLLAPHLSVAENIFLGREERLPFGWVNRRRMTAEAARLIEEHHFPLGADGRVERLSPAGKQLVEICRAIHHGSSLLIFDEPTSSLSGQETEEVFRIVRTLRARRMGVVYITHRMEELRAIGDRVTILRDGATVHAGPLAEMTTDHIIQHMVGREMVSLYRRQPLAPGRELLRAEGLTRKGALRDVSFTLRAGEIVGLAGLIGAGRTETCRAIFGVDPIDSGRIFIEGRETPINSPRDAVAQGIALVTEDRQKTGLALRLSIGHNVTMANLPAVSRFGLLDAAAETRETNSYIGRLQIRSASPRQAAGRSTRTLSLAARRILTAQCRIWRHGDHRNEARLFAFPPRSSDQCLNMPVALYRRVSTEEYAIVSEQIWPQAQETCITTSVLARRNRRLYLLRGALRVVSTRCLGLAPANSSGE